MHRETDEEWGERTLRGKWEKLKRGKKGFTHRGKREKEIKRTEKRVERKRKKRGWRKEWGKRGREKEGKEREKERERKEDRERERSPWAPRPCSCLAPLLTPMKSGWCWSWGPHPGHALHHHRCCFYEDYGQGGWRKGEEEWNVGLRWERRGEKWRRQKVRVG